MPLSVPAERRQASGSTGNFILQPDACRSQEQLEAFNVRVTPELSTRALATRYPQFRICIMPSTPTRQTRMPLRPLTNASNSPAPPVRITKAGDRTSANAGSTPGKNPLQKAQRNLPLRSSLPPMPQKENPNAKSPQMKKKPRPSLSKRVSFGKNSFSIIYAQEHYSSPENEPNHKVAKLNASFSPRQSPSISRPSYNVFPAADEASENDTLTMPDAPNFPAASPMPHIAPAHSEESPSSNEDASPIPVRRQSVGVIDRQSFGVFVDEDVTMGHRDVSLSGHDEDTTQMIPVIGSSLRARRSSMASVVSEGDITQQIVGVFPDLVGYDEANAEPLDPSEPLENNWTSSPSPSMPEPLASGTSPDKLNDVNDQPLLRDSADPHENQGGGTSNRAEAYDEDASFEVDNARAGAADIPSLMKDGNDQLSDFPKGSDQDVPEISHKQKSTAPIAGGEDDSIVSLSKKSSDTNKTHHPSKSPSFPRPLPPNRRKLFDFDTQEDEDTTLHYHAEGSDRTPNAHAKFGAAISSRPHPLTNDASKMHGSRSTIPQTPLSATGAKVLAVLEDRVTAKENRNAASQLKELSNSAMRAVTHQNEEDPRQVHGSIDFKFDDFMTVCNLDLEYKHPALQRATSLATQSIPLHSFDRSSAEGKAYESAKRECVLARLTQEIRRGKDEIARDVKMNESLAENIERSAPPLFSKIATHGSLPLQELTTIRCGVKRLRKDCYLQGRRGWITDREVWEKDISGSMEQICDAFKADNFAMKQSCKILTEQDSNFEKSLQTPELSKALSSRLCCNDKADIVRRRAAIHNLSRLRDIQNYAQSQEIEEEELSRRRDSLISHRNFLSTTSKRLEMFSDASTSRKLKKLLTEKRELNAITSGVTGLKLFRVSKSSLSLRIVDMMDTQFSLHDDRVINISCKPVRYPDNSTIPAWHSFVESAVEAAITGAGVKTVKQVRGIPHALHRSADILYLARAAFEDAALYLDNHIGNMAIGGGMEDNKSLCVPIRVAASFYSLRLRSKFDVHVCVRTRLPVDDNSFGCHEATIEKITRFIGAEPCDEDIGRVLLESGRRTRQLFSFREAFAALRALL